MALSTDSFAARTVRTGMCAIIRRPSAATVSNGSFVATVSAEASARQGKAPYW